jgi:hypothetical protein
MRITSVKNNMSGELDLWEKICGNKKNVSAYSLNKSSLFQENVINSLNQSSNYMYHMLEK